MERSKRLGRLRHALLERLVHYYYFVTEQQEHGCGDTVTSTRIARLMQMDDTLVRKDLAAIGVRGYPRVGFKCSEVADAIRKVLGFDETYRAVIIGIGWLGSAMASYRGFSRYGLEICGLFDCDPVKIGLMRDNLVVLPMERLPLVVRQQGVSMAILTVPVDAAQEVADFAVAAGVKAIWNFASTNLELAEAVLVRHEHISVGLAELGYQLKQAGAAGPPDAPAGKEAEA